MNYNKKTVYDVDVKGKKVLLRCDFNVPQDKKTGEITSDKRIKAALPTIRYLLDNGAAVIACSHLGKPVATFEGYVKKQVEKGKNAEDVTREEWEKSLRKLTLAPVAKHLGELLGQEVIFASDVVGEDAQAKAAALQPGQIMLLENLRFEKGETKNDPALAKKLAEMAELYVSDAFGTVHRAHASTAGVAAYLPAVSGLLIQKELEIMGGALENPKRPFVAILGGAKVSDKIGVINNLLEKADTIIIGGGMAYTFIKAMGHNVGTSLLEADKVDYAKEMLAKAAARTGGTLEDFAKDLAKKGVFDVFKRKLAAAHEGNENRPKTLLSYSKKGEDYMPDAKLLTDFLSRVDYGDLGKSGEFQQCLFDTFNAYFGIKENDIFEAVRNKLVSKGLDITSNFTHEIISNTEFEDFEKIGIKLKSAHETVKEWSMSDVQKWFTLTLVNILKSQTDKDCKVGNIVRSLPTLKAAVRLWFKLFALPSESEDRWYRVFLNDVINKEESSIFRRLITDTLKNYHPILEEQLRQRREENEQRQNEPFMLKNMYAFTEEYEALHENKCLFSPFYLRKDYKGRKTEEAFARYLDSQDCIEWWFKNGDSGKDWLGIRYYNEVTQQEALFYPDWIYKKIDGTIGIFDTKDGITASDLSTKNKAEALQKRIMHLNAWHRESIRYEGGIAIRSNGMWYYNDNKTYIYHTSSTDEWKIMNDLFA